MIRERRDLFRSPLQRVVICYGEKQQALEDLARNEGVQLVEGLPDDLYERFENQPEKMDLDEADAWQSVFTLPVLMTDAERAIVDELTGNMRAAEQASLEDLASMDPGELLDDPADAAAPLPALDDLIANFQPVGSPLAISTPRSTPPPTPPPRRRPRTTRRPPTRQQEVADLTAQYTDLERRLFDNDNVPSPGNT
ncbi:hypothetical protein AC249_AIPGENE24496 [Exaiptasia diaphana]|nr:hypothetical protein AC249_AIPGENE24496 [Exaiptasia diaphana]